MTDGLGISRSVTSTETVGAPLTVGVTQASSPVTGPILTKLDSPVNLSATGGSTYAWSATPAGTSTQVATGTASSFVFSPTAPGTYTVTVIAFDSLGDQAASHVHDHRRGAVGANPRRPSNLYEAEGSPFTLSSLVNNAPANSSLAWTISQRGGAGQFAGHDVELHLTRRPISGRTPSR